MLCSLRIGRNEETLLGERHKNLPFNGCDKCTTIHNYFPGMFLPFVFPVIYPSAIQTQTSKRTGCAKNRSRGFLRRELFLPLQRCPSKGHPPDRGADVSLCPQHPLCPPSRPRTAPCVGTQPRSAGAPPPRPPSPSSWSIAGSTRPREKGSGQCRTPSPLATLGSR